MRVYTLYTRAHDPGGSHLMTVYSTPTTIRHLSTLNTLLLLHKAVHPARFCSKVKVKTISASLNWVIVCALIRQHNNCPPGLRPIYIYKLFMFMVKCMNIQRYAPGVSSVRGASRRVFMIFSRDDVQYIYVYHVVITTNLKTSFYVVFDE